MNVEEAKAAGTAAKARDQPAPRPSTVSDVAAETTAGGMQHDEATVSTPMTVPSFAVRG
jgi:hypothetical protein